MASQTERTLGLGIDVLEVARMKSFISNHQKRLHRVFSPTEQKWACSTGNTSVNYSCLFAAKEAVFKSLGMSPVHFFRWDEIEIIPGQSNHRVSLNHSLKRLIDSTREVCRVIWEIRKGYAVAFATREKICAGF